MIYDGDCNICDDQAAKTGTMTVSSPGLGQVALQIQQQVSQVSHPEPPALITTLQSPQGAAWKMRGQQTAVQVVQQVNQAGQVVHQVLQTVPQSSSQAGLSPAPSLQTSMAPLTTLGETQTSQSCPPSSNLLDISVPTSIASKLPTAPLARPDLPTSSTAGTVVASASPQQNPSGGKPGENQQEAISAIVHSLMMAETQLKLEEQRKAGPVLPTVPVPAANPCDGQQQQDCGEQTWAWSWPPYLQSGHQSLHLSLLTAQILRVPGPGRPGGDCRDSLSPPGRPSGSSQRC